MDGAHHKTLRSIFCALLQCVCCVLCYHTII